MKIWVRFEVQWTVTYDVTQVEFEEDISIVFYLMRSDTHVSFVPLVNGTCEPAFVHLIGACDWLFIFVQHKTVLVDGNVRCLHYDKKDCNIIRLENLLIIKKLSRRNLCKTLQRKLSLVRNKVMILRDTITHYRNLHKTV